jgi:hypothetical protein
VPDLIVVRRAKRDVSYQVRVLILQSPTKQYVSSLAMKSAKPLKAGGSPSMIVTGSAAQRRGRMAKRLRRSVDREAPQAARSLASSPKHDKPRKKVGDVEGERVIRQPPDEASIVVCATGECAAVPPGSVAVACVQRNVVNPGDLPRTRKGLPVQLTEGRYCEGRSQTCHSTLRR